MAPNASMDRLRELRAFEVGRKLACVAIPLYAFTSSLDLWVGAPAYVHGTNFLAIAGAGLTLLIQKDYPYLRRLYFTRFPAWPLALTFWFVMTAAVQQTGGITSPYLGFTLAFLLLGLMVMQTRFNAGQVAAFTGANLVFWIVEHMFGWLPNLPAPPVGIIASVNAVHLVGIFFCIRELVRTEHNLIDRGAEQTRLLTEARSQLSHNARMAEVGNLVATTAHEMAQPIQVIQTATTLISRLIGKPDRIETARTMTTRLGESANRLSSLLLQLRDFSRKEDLQLTRQDARETVRAITRLTEYDLRYHNVHLKLSAPDEPLWTRVDTMKIQQVLLNLVNNARDASIQGVNPVVEVSASRYRGWTRLMVRNTGPQIPLSVQGKLFEPYFTTKPLGNGTGLGLTICAQIVRQHGGRIQFSSSDHETVFIVDLPALTDASASVKPGLRLSLVPSDRSDDQSSSSSFSPRTAPPNT